MIETGLKLAQTELERFRFYEIEVLSLVAQQKGREAILRGIEALRRVGVYLPEDPSQPQTIWRLLKMLLRMTGKSQKSLLQLPLMSDPEKVSISSLLNIMGPATAVGMPALMPLITFEVMTLSLQYGHSQASAVYFMVFAYIICEKIGKVNLGYELGKVSIKIGEKIGSKAISASTTFLWWYYVAYRKESLRNALPMMLEAYQNGVEDGNLEYAGYAFDTHCFYAYLAGHNLDTLKKKYIESQHAVKRINHETVTGFQQLYIQIIDNLTKAKDGEVFIIQGDFFDEEKIESPVVKLRL